MLCIPHGTSLVKLLVSNWIKPLALMCLFCPTLWRKLVDILCYSHLIDLSVLLPWKAEIKDREDPKKLFFKKKKTTKIVIEDSLSVENIS